MTIRWFKFCRTILVFNQIPKSAWNPSMGRQNEYLEILYLVLDLTVRSLFHYVWLLSICYHCAVSALRRMLLRLLTYLLFYRQSPRYEYTAVTAVCIYRGDWRYITPGGILHWWHITPLYYIIILLYYTCRSKHGGTENARLENAWPSKTQHQTAGLENAGKRPVLKDWWNGTLCSTAIPGVAVVCCLLPWHCLSTVLVLGLVMKNVLRRASTTIIL